MFKRIAAIMVLITMCLSILPYAVIASDAELQRYWKFSDQYIQAVDSKDYDNIISYGEQVVGIFEGTKLDNTERDILCMAYINLAHAYEYKKNYPKSIENYKKFIPLAESIGLWEYVIQAEYKLFVLNESFDLYYKSKTDDIPYYGAKLEPKSGIYYGTTYDNDERINSFYPDLFRKYFPKQNSAYLLYLEFGEEIDTPLYNHYFKTIEQQGNVLELAWNTYEPIYNMEQHRDYIKRTLDFLKKYNLKVLLRFACEMNVGENGSDKNAYVDAFRYVASCAHEYDNIAMLWSPNVVGAIDKPFEDFYPGDEYVDWVGVSLYSIKYFLGQKDHGNQQDAVDTYFLTGENMNPVLSMRPIMDFMEKNNIKKPVAVSEGGVTSYIRPLDEYTGDWRFTQLRLMYAELMRVYPQIKAMFYFNVKIPHEANQYELFNDQPMNDLYNELVEDDYYMSYPNENPDFYYKKAENTILVDSEEFELSASAYYPKVQDLTVKYFLDGEEVYSTNTIPYVYKIQSGILGDANHHLKAEVYAGGIKVMEREYSLVNAIKVKLNGEMLKLPINPTIESDRTLVPLRVIFEALNAEVVWEDTTRTVKAKKGNISMELSIDSHSVIINSKTEIIDVPPRLIGDYTMIPIRIVAETFGATVNWDSNTQTVEIITEK